jgi:hypothetical protein
MANTVLAADALAANRVGQLSDSQQRGLSALASSNRRSAFTFAALFLAMGLLIAMSTSAKVSTLQRTLVAGGCLAISGFAIFRSVSGTDALTRDLREGRVESVDGAIGKRRTSGSRGRSLHYLDVGDRRFQVSVGTYMAAPDAGFVNIFFLPRSRKVVNYELLPQAPVGPNESLRDAAVTAGKALLSGDRRQRNEAKAEVARLGSALESSWAAAQAAPPAGDGDSRPLAVAIVGTWASGIIRVTFSSDGHVAVNMLGAVTNGRWSVDGHGQLTADVNGRAGTTDAHIAGQQLTVTLDGRRLTFTRVPDAPSTPHS